MSDYRQYQVEQKAEKSIPVAVFLALFLPPLAYVYLGNWKLAVINTLTLNYLMLGIVIVPLHVLQSIRKNRDLRDRLATAE